NTAAEEVPDAKRATDEGDGMRIDPASRIELVDALLNFFRSSRNTGGECLRLVHHLACVLDRTAFSRGCQGVLLQWESSIAARACPSGTLRIVVRWRDPQTWDLPPAWPSLAFARSLRGPVF